MTCTSCGAALRPGAMFCGECGQKVTVLASAPAAEASAAPLHTVPVSRLAAGVPHSIAVRPPPPVRVVADDDLDRTILAAPTVVEELDDDVERTVLAVRRTPAFTLTGPDGIAHPIRSATVIGRAPTRPTHRPGIELLALVDVTKSLSKSHAVVEPDGDIFTIEDLNSTNGVVIVGDDGSETNLPTGRRTPIPPGTVLALGDYIVTVGRS